MLCPLARGRSVRWTPRRLPRPGPRRSPLGAGTCPESDSSFFIPWPLSLQPLGVSSPCSQFHSDPIACQGAQIPAPPPPLGLGGAL